MTDKNSLKDMSPANLMDLYDLTDDDLECIRALVPVIGDRMEHFIAEFYTWLEGRPEYDEFFPDPEIKARAAAGQQDYWRNFFDARVDEAYVERLRVLGGVHAQIDLSLEAYFSGVNAFLNMFVATIAKPKSGVQNREKTIAAVTKLAHLDTAVVVSTFSERTRQIISEQNQTLMQLSTPVSMLWDDILMLPIVGVVDSKRAQDIMDAMLLKIDETNARAMIIDISGVSVIDTAVANHFLKMTKATTLMGCNCIISGISPVIAQTIVSLGIDLADINTCSTLKDALDFAFEETGQKSSVIAKSAR
jgi:rsbT co-antagonist protein RsbR